MANTVYMSITLGELGLVLKSEGEDDAADPQAELAKLQEYLKLGDRLTINLVDMRGQAVHSHFGRITLVAQPPAQVAKGAT